jgi:hypothetical protein
LPTVVLGGSVSLKSPPDGGTDGRNTPKIFNEKLSNDTFHLKPVLRIRILTDPFVFGLLDPAPLDSCMYPDPDPSMIKRK